VEGQKACGLMVNQITLNLICSTGIPLTIVNSEEWKDLIGMLDSHIRIILVVLSQMCIFQWRQLGSQKRHQKLSKVKNLMISYDGGTTKAVKSIYTIHVTTPKVRKPP